MMRRTVLPLAMLAVVFGAFLSAAWAVADGNDFVGIYFVVLAAVALRAQTRIAEAA